MSSWQGQLTNTYFKLVLPLGPAAIFKWQNVSGWNEFEARFTSRHTPQKDVPAFNLNSLASIDVNIIQTIILHFTVANLNFSTGATNYGYFCSKQKLWSKLQFQSYRDSRCRSNTLESCWWVAPTKPTVSPLEPKSIEAIARVINHIFNTEKWKCKLSLATLTYTHQQQQTNQFWQ